MDARSATLTIPIEPAVLEALRGHADAALHQSPEALAADLISDYLRAEGALKEEEANANA